MPKVFISHSWEDNDISRQLAADLKRDGADIWIDYARIKGGQSLPEVIGQAIEESDILVLVWSKSAATSYYVRLEWNCALNLRKRIIPCVMDNTKLPPILSAFLYHSFIKYDEGYSFLLRDLRLQQQSQTTPQPPEKNELIKTPKKPLSEARNEILVDIDRRLPKTLDSDDVKSILKKFDLFDKNKNPNGKGITHKYQEQSKNNDLVVIDHATGLMWQKLGSESRMNFDKAGKWVDDLNNKAFAGYKDWRLPTLEEAMSLMERTKENGDLYIDKFFDQTQLWIWTGDKVKGASRAWVVSFYYGFCDYDGLDTNDYVRAVRS